MESGLHRQCMIFLAGDKKPPVSVMYNRIMTLLAGVALISLGLGFIFYRWDHLHGFPVPRSTGIIVSFFGVVVFLSALFRKRKSFQDEERFLICSKCLALYARKNIIGGLCPKCSENLEELSGFYEKHPELKQK